MMVMSPEINMVHVQMYQCENRPPDWPFSKLFECDRYKIEYGKMFSYPEVVLFNKF